MGHPVGPASSPSPQPSCTPLAPGSCSLATSHAMPAGRQVRAPALPPHTSLIPPHPHLIPRARSQ
jgi:hypothetical protein